MYNIIGKKVTHDVVNSAGLVLIKAKDIIEEEHLNLLEKHRIDLYSIIMETGNGTKYTHSNSLVLQAMEQSYTLFESIKLTYKIPIMLFKHTVIPIIQQIANDPNIFRLFEAVRAKDEYTHQHNIGVGVISTLLGKWLNLGEIELAVLSLAATLHDVGKVKIPMEILQKPEKLSQAEFNLMKQHTNLGYEMLKGTIGVSHRIALVALQHHEREDGSGYPLSLKMSQINSFSKIVAVADMFHAMSSNRPYHKAIPFSEILEQLRQESFGKLDPYIVAVFIKNISKQLVGQQVVLTDGREGKIVYLKPFEDNSSLIKINNDFLDLSLNRNITIMQIVS